MKRTGLFMVAFFAVVSLIGCGHTINVQQSLSAEDDVLPVISAAGPVDLEVVPMDLEGDVEFCRAGTNKFSTDFNEFSAYALQSVTDMLQRNDISIAKGAEKKIVVSVSEATCQQEAWDINFIAHLDVTTGDQLTKRFTGNQRIWTLHGVDFALSAAVLNATIEMLKDEDIRSYLEK